MNKFKIILVFILCVMCFEAVVEVSSLMGGTELYSSEEYPFVVSLRYMPNYHFCGGSIIDERFILTAAHCLEDYKMEDVLVIVGTNKRKFTDDSDSYSIENWSFHEMYDPNLIKYDIAVIRVTRDIIFKPNVQPIKLAKIFTAKIDDEVVLLGFGRVEPKCSASPRLLHKLITYRINPVAVTKNEASQLVPRNLFIFTFANNSISQCAGDSGGPVIREKAGELTQVGVQSVIGARSGVYCNEHISIPKFVYWIEKTKRKMLLRATILGKIRNQLQLNQLN